MTSYEAVVRDLDELRAEVTQATRGALARLTMRKDSHRGVREHYMT